MATDLDELQIKISSSSDGAAEAIEKLVEGLTSLNAVIENLDVSKISTFASALTKISNIGQISNTSSKALRGMRNQITKTFGIKSADGIKQVDQALNEFYESTKRSSKDASLPTQKIYEDNARALYKAIKDNARYKKELDDDTAKIKALYDAAQKEGTKYSIKGFKNLFGDSKDFEKIKKELGSVFSTAGYGNQKGLQDLDTFFQNVYNDTKNPLFYQNAKENVLIDYKAALEAVAAALKEARQAEISYDEAKAAKQITGEEAKTQLLSTAEQLKALVKAQNELNAGNGLNGVVSAMKALSSIHFPDLTGVADAVKAMSKNPPVQTAKAVKDTADSAKQLEQTALMDPSRVQAAMKAAYDIEPQMEYWRKLQNGVRSDSKRVLDPSDSFSSWETFFDGQERGWTSTIEKMSAAERLAQSFRDSFSEFHTPEIDEYLGRTLESVDSTASEVETKLLPAVINADSALNQMYSRIMSNMSAIHTVNEEAFSKWLDLAYSEPNWDDQGMHYAEVMRKNNGSEAFDKTAEAATNASNAIDGVTTATSSLSDQLKNEENSAKEAFNAIEAIEGFHMDDLGTGLGQVDNEFVNIGKSAKDAASEIGEALKQMHYFKDIISKMESGDVPFFENIYKNSVMGFNEAKDKVDTFKKSLERKAPATLMADVIPKVQALGDALSKLSSRLGKLGDKHIAVLKAMSAPFNMAAKEYIEKFQSMQKSLMNFQKNFKASMKKISDFWKRTMRTFTFMVVRKAFTAILKEIGNAIQSLALYSNMMGTAFNTDLSNMVADFQYLGRSIVSVFAPLLNYIAPIIDAITSKIATLLSYIGMLIAALGGKATFTKAKKNVTNYAESLDQASKSAKSLTMGIDELNIVSESSSGGSSKPYDGFEDAWDEVEIPDWIINFADKLKDIWSKIFDPLKTAWDRAKQYVIDGFKTMRNSLQKLFGDIGRDFLEVWNQEETIRMFEQLFRIIGDIERVVRNLADQFDKAWNSNKTGKKILENIRDIFAILIDHARNISYYMIGWAESIDFKPLLTNFEKLTKQVKKLADFLGGVIEDIFKLGILKYVKWLIEKGLPDLYKTISKIIDLINWKTLRSRLQPLWTAIEEALQHIHEGVTEAIDNVGSALARFINSNEFNDFLQTLVNLAKEITSERVEKVLTGIGQGILAVAEAVVKFVNSSVFQGFIQFIGDWIDNHSTEDIANIFTRLATAIGLFKFGEFAADKMSGFFEFATVLLAFSSIANIIKNLINLNDTLARTGAATSKIASSGSLLVTVSDGLKTILPLIGSVIAGFLEFQAVSKSVEKLTKILDGGEGSLGWTVAGLATSVGIAGVAFTALLGVPAGLIATAAVGSVAAIKGINDALEQINLERTFDAVRTQGDTTVSQVKQWYGEVTEEIRKRTDEWKQFERNLTQDKSDIESYTKALEGLHKAFESSVPATASMADTLMNKYGDLKNSIFNYIDTSTQGLVDMTMANEEAYEKSGQSVADLTTGYYHNAEKQKQIIQSAYEEMEKASDAYKEAVEKSGADSKDAADKYQILLDKTAEFDKVIADFQTTADELDTSNAQEQITELGEKLDLTQYGNFDEASKDIAGALTEIHTIYDTELTGIQSTLETELGFIEEQFRNHQIDEDDYNFKKVIAWENYQNDFDTLNSKTQEALDFFNKGLSSKLGEVAAAAEAEWEGEKDPIVRLFNGTKEKFVNKRITTYVDNMLGANGLSGEMRKAYDALPEDLRSNAITAMESLSEYTKNAYQGRSSKDIEAVNKSTYAMWQQYISGLPAGLDYSGMIEAADKQTESFKEASHNNLPPVLSHLVDWWNGLTKEKTQDIDVETPSKDIAERNAESLDENMKTATSNIKYEDSAKIFTDKIGESINSEAVAKLPEIAQEEVTVLNDEFYGAIDGADIAESGVLYNTKIGEAITEQTAPLDEAVQTASLGVIEGFNEGIEANMSLTENVVNTFFSKLNDWIHNNPIMPFGSPNKKTIEYGKDIVQGLIDGIAALTNGGQVGMAVINLFTKITTVMNQQMDVLKGNVRTKMVELFNFSDFNVETPIAALFVTITATVESKINELGIYVSETLLPMFMETYVLPYFTIDMWQPYFDTLMNDVFTVNFTTFTTWFKDSMTKWWNEELLIWFKPAKWNKEVYEPLQKNREQRYAQFLEWWAKSMKIWWEEKTMPYLKPTFWNEKVYIPLEKNRLQHYRDFIDWWMKSIKSWWEEKTMPYFKDLFWDEQIYNPLRDNLYKHFKSFLEWWDRSLADWWLNHTMPYFERQLWREQFDIIHEVAEHSFDKVRNAIQERIHDAAASVADACGEMASSLNEVLSLIGEVMTAISGFGELGGNVTFNYKNSFAEGGYPTVGSLFLAGEAGAEMVGNIGGKTGVVSNDEITGIADAVYSTGNQESALLGQLIRVTQALLEKEPVVLGDKAIAEMANNGQSQLGMSIIS